MDPVTIIGVTSSVLAFIDHAYVILQAAKNIYDGATGQTIENVRLESLTADMENISKRLESGKPLLDQSEDEKILDHLATQCHEFSKEILTRLSKVKAKKRHNVPESIKAAFRAAWNKEEINEMQRKLDRYWAQLNLQLTAITRYETVKRLDKLIKSAKSDTIELGSLHRQTQRLLAGVSTDNFAPEALHQIKELFNLTEEALGKCCVDKILDALRYPKLDERYYDVAKAHDSTFEWIFEDEKRLLSTQTGLEISFTEWLAMGEGIFHISGKPGAGKSSLLKFLFKYPRTIQELKTWAGDKKLVLAKFFFWKPGNDPMQKSLDGLVRSLLYSFLSQARELIATTFPTHWERVRSSMLGSQFDLRFENHEIRSGFDQLFVSGDSAVYQDHCVCFFIDGFDEFDGKEDHDYFAKYLLSIIATGPGTTKLCLSSRVMNVLEKVGSPWQKNKINLHQLTKTDIESFVRGKLRGHERFSELEEQLLKDCEKLIDKIVRKAEGVFLWVTLVVKSLCQGLTDQCTLSELYQQVDLFPDELEPFFEHILKSIPTSYRKKSYRTLAVATWLNANAVNQSGMSLLRYSFLLGELHENPRFAIEAETDNLSDEIVQTRLIQAHTRLNASCKGLLEVRDPDHRSILRSSVTLTHRSIQEFLGSDKMKSLLSAYLTDFNLLEAVCHTLLAEVKLVCPKLSIDQFADDTRELLGNIVYHCRKGQSSKECFQALQLLDAALCYRQGVKSREECDWSRFTLGIKSRDSRVVDSDFGPDLEGCVEFFSLPHVAAFYGIFEYVEWATRIDHSLVRCCWNSSFLLRQLMLHFAQFDKDGIYPLLEALFTRGLDPNSTPGAANRDGLSTWHGYLKFLVLHGVPLKEPHCRCIEIFLKFGANLDFSWEYGYDGYIDFTIKGTIVRENFRPWDEPPEEGSSTFRVPEGKQSLKNLIDSAPPDSAKILRELLEKDLERKRPTLDLERDPPPDAQVEEVDDSKPMLDSKCEEELGVDSKGQSKSLWRKYLINSFRAYLRALGKPSWTKFILIYVLAAALPRIWVIVSKLWYSRRGKVGTARSR